METRKPSEHKVLRAFFFDWGVSPIRAPRHPRRTSWYPSSSPNGSRRYHALKQDPSLPKTFLARRISYKKPGFDRVLLLTSLLDSVTFPRDELIELYHKRWEIELGYDEIKTDLCGRREAIRRKTPDGVRQELWGILLVYNLVRVGMERTAHEAKVEPTRISFVESLRLIRTSGCGKRYILPLTLASPDRSVKRCGIAPYGDGALDGWAGSGTSAEMFHAWALQLRSWLRRWPVLPLVFGVILLGVGYQTRMQAVDRMLPYCVHIDEHVWTEQSIRMLKTGDLNPHRFTKPSVMAYLNTAGFALGLLRGGMSGELPDLEKLHEGGFPYYSSSTMIRTVRQIYVVLSLASLVLCAFVARHLVQAGSDRRKGGAYGITPGNLVALLTLGLGLLSPLYLSQSVRYLNVDLVGCFVNVCAMSYFVLHPRATKPHVFGVLAGVAVGFCVGTKYNYYPMLAPALLVVAARYRAHWLSTSLLLLVSTVVTFLITTPYALLDLPAFAWSAAGEALHYAVGHQPGKAPHSAHVMEPGLKMFAAYAGTVTANYGYGLAILAGFGLWRALRLRPLSSSVFVLFPALLWLYMSKQRAFFDRNLLVLQVVVPVFAAIGTSFIGQKVIEWVKSRRQLDERWVVATPAAVLALALIAFPFGAYAAALERLDDSRTQVAAWLQDQRPASGLVLVPEELEVDLRTFPTHLKARRYAARKTDLDTLGARHPGALALVPVFSGRTKPKAMKSALKTFGRNDAKTKRGGQWGASVYVLRGNPKFFVVQL